MDGTTGRLASLQFALAASAKKRSPKEQERIATTCHWSFVGERHSDEDVDFSSRTDEAALVALGPFSPIGLSHEQVLLPHPPNGRPFNDPQGEELPDDNAVRAGHSDCSRYRDNLDLDKSS